MVTGTLIIIFAVAFTCAAVWMAFIRKHFRTVLSYTMMLFTCVVSFVALLGLGETHWRDAPPAVSPSEQLVRVEAPELFRAPVGNARAGELVANLHYTTKRFCGMDDKGCYEQRTARYLPGAERTWADMGAYTRIEDECSARNSDRYGVCLMNEWWQHYENNPDDTPDGTLFAALADDESLKALACDRDPVSPYHC